MKILIDLFLTFARIGGFTFGGGYAMLPMLRSEVVEKRGWATEEELMDYYAIGQCTPGIIAVNTATFIGYKTAGIIGGIVATLGVVAPSVVIISILAGLIRNFSELWPVRYALEGIRACVFVLVFSTVIKLSRKALVNAVSYLIFGCVLLLALFTEVSTVWLVILSGIVGIVYGRVRKEKG
ncbi:MAG: chromate transporter [Blautia sp.]|nr:chromate transporter [Blautia sp.]